MLVIDDNPGDVYLLKIALYSSGVDNLAVVSDNGLKALEICQNAGTHPDNTLPDLVFLDLNLEPTNGFDVLTCIRQNPHLDSTPVVIVSGSDNPKDVALCYELKANAYMLKTSPIEDWFAQVHAVVKFWLGVRLNTSAGRPPDSFG